LDIEGNIFWNNFIFFNENADYLKLTLDFENNIFLMYNNQDWEFKDTRLIKLNSRGEPSWTANLPYLYQISSLGISTDVFGNLIMAGKSNVSWGNPLRSFSGNSDGYLCKILFNPQKMIYLPIIIK
jgi:hypothetical protein